MINLSQKNVVKIAKETNFIKDNVEKVMRLADILEFVFTSKWEGMIITTSSMCWAARGILKRPSGRTPCMPAIFIF